MSKKLNSATPYGKALNMKRTRVDGQERARAPSEQQQHNGQADGWAKSCIAFQTKENQQVSDDDAEELHQIQNQVTKLKTKLDQVESRKRDCKADRKQLTFSEKHKMQDRLQEEQRMREEERVQRQVDELA